MKTLTAFLTVVIALVSFTSCSMAEPSAKDDSLRSVITEVYQDDSVLVIGYKDATTRKIAEIVVELEDSAKGVYFIELNAREYKVEVKSNIVIIGTEYWQL
jgi:hypothetical protein